MTIKISPEAIADLNKAPAYQPDTHKCLNELAKPAENIAIVHDGQCEAAESTPRTKGGSSAIDSRPRSVFAREMLNACGNISLENREAILSGLMRSPLKNWEIQRFLCAMNESMACAEPEHRASVEASFISVLTVKNGSSLLEKDRDPAGRTLLDHLHSLATSPRESLIPQLRSKRAELLSSLLSEIADPDKTINQGRDSTCVSTVGQHQLVRDNPAEYARLIDELSMTGQCRLTTRDSQTGALRLSRSQADEPTLKVRVSSLAATESSDLRSLTERMFQTAITDLYAEPDGGMCRKPSELCYEAVFGQPFKRLDGDGATDFLQSIKNSPKDSINIASIKWETKGDHTNHAIEILKIENGVVFFRNPWGKEFQHIPAGLNVNKIDGEKALYAISEADLTNRFNWALVSDSSPHAMANWGLSPDGMMPTAPAAGDSSRTVEQPTIFFDYYQPQVATNSVSQSAQPKTASVETKFTAQHAAAEEHLEDVIKRIRRKADA